MRALLFTLLGFLCNFALRPNSPEIVRLKANFYAVSLKVINSRKLMNDQDSCKIFWQFDWDFDSFCYFPSSYQDPVRSRLRSHCPSQWMVAKTGFPMKKIAVFQLDNIFIEMAIDVIDVGAIVHSNLLDFRLGHKNIHFNYQINRKFWYFWYLTALQFRRLTCAVHFHQGWTTVITEVPR